MLEDRERMQPIIDEHLRDREEVKVLEAGCGSTAHVDLGSKAIMTGIDISEKQLERNEKLDEKILGDLQTHPLPENAYDMIVCWDVLEHLRYPKQALNNMMSAAAPDGLILIKVPNLLSLKGLITKLTPHRFHVWFYRRIYGVENAGRDDNPPFRTYMRFAVRPAGLRKLAKKHGLAIIDEHYWESKMQITYRTERRAVRLLWKPMRWLFLIISLGRIHFERTEYMLLLHKEVERQSV